MDKPILNCSSLTDEMEYPCLAIVSGIPRLNFRAIPSIRGAISEYLCPGNKLKVLRILDTENETWAEVQTHRYRTGYVVAKYLEVQDDE